jgi:hypothetical protein
MRVVQRFALVALAGGLGFTAACGLLLGIDDVSPRGDASDEQGLLDVAADGVQPDATPCVPGLAADESKGVFVSSAGAVADAGAGDAADAADPADATDPGDAADAAEAVDAAGGPGSRTAPFDTIAAGLAAAVTRGLAFVYVEEGIYPEQVTFPSQPDAGASPVIVVGGWKRGTSAWLPDCNGDVRTKTVIQSPSAVGVVATNVQNNSGLRNLTVANTSPPQAAIDTSGGSTIGVRVGGAKCSFVLDSVIVLSAAGGAPGIATAASGTGVVGGCPSGTSTCENGLSGAAGGAGAGSNRGSYSADGDYSPGAGGSPGPAGVGATGHSGSPGGPGQTGGCWQNCVNPAPCNPSTACDGTQVASQAASGLCGCGGGGGPPGLPGYGGGGSFGVVVSGLDSRVTVTATRLGAAAGAAGGAGSSGGSGGAGNVGVAGGTLSCGADCGGTSGCDGTCYSITAGSLSGGAAGGQGGQGGQGGAGGGGAGGPSCGVLLMGNASVATDPNTELAHDVGGIGAGGAAAGEAASTCAH